MAKYKFKRTIMCELTEWDCEQIDRMINGNPNAGMLVETKTGLKGRTYSNEDYVNGKIRVYTSCGKKLLCSPETLILKGFVD